MSVQRVGGVDLTLIGFTTPELLVALQALSRDAQRQARQNGVRPATLGGVIERMTRAAAELADRNPDIRTGRPQARSGHPAAPAAGAGAQSATSSPHGSARLPSTREVAEHLGISPRHVRRLVDQGLLDGAAVDGRGTYAIDPASVAVWEAQRTTRKEPHDGLEPARTSPSDRGPDPGRDQSAAATA